LEGRKMKIKSALKNVKSYAVNTSTRTLYYVPLIGLWEKVVGGFDNPKLLKSRLTAVAINLFAGQIHDFSRKITRNLTGTNDFSSERRKFYSDTLAGAVVGVLTYGLCLAVADVSPAEAKLTLPFAVAFTTSTGRFYGRFNDRWREKFDLEPVYSNSNVWGPQA